MNTWKELAFSGEGKISTTALYVLEFTFRDQRRASFFFRKAVQRFPSVTPSSGTVLNTRTPTSVFALIIFLHPRSSLYTSRSDQRDGSRVLACCLLFLHFLVWDMPWAEPQPVSNFLSGRRARWPRFSVGTLTISLQSFRRVSGFTTKKRELHPRPKENEMWIRRKRWNLEKIFSSEQRN